MCQFENYFNPKIKDSFLKSILVLFLFISYTTIKAQEFSIIDSTEIARRVAFQDSIFKRLIPVQPYIKNKPVISKSEYVAIDSTSNNTDSQKVKNNFVINNKDSILSNSIFSEKSQSAKIKKQKKIDTTHYSPKKAAIWAAGFPGLGQIYMKKYWKLPIVYGVIGAALYFVVSNGQNLRKYNGYISNVYDSIQNPSPIDQLDLSNLETRRNTYRKNLQIASFGTVFAWGLSIVDAVVDAHLHSFDISDKLAIKVKPQINYSNFTYYSGIGLNLTIK